MHGPMVWAGRGGQHAFKRPPSAGRDEGLAMLTPDLRWLRPATHAPRAPAAPRAPLWPVAGAVAVGLGLLLAFQQVVAQAVAQAELRRSSAAAQHELGWRCRLALHAGSHERCPASVVEVHDRASRLREAGTVFAGTQPENR